VEVAFHLQPFAVYLSFSLLKIYRIALMRRPPGLVSRQLRFYGIFIFLLQIYIQRFLLALGSYACGFFFFCLNEVFSFAVR
jgi:hypothetical protein